MRHRLLPALILATLATLSSMNNDASARPTRPPAGVPIDESRPVSLPTTAPAAPCLAIPLGSAQVLVGVDLLESLVRAKPAHWTTDDERVASEHADGAAEVLAMPRTGRTADGCELVSAERARRMQDLLPDLLEEGRLAVRASTGALSPALRVRYHARQAGPMRGSGVIEFWLPGDAAPFFIANWWIS